MHTHHTCTLTDVRSLLHTGANIHVHIHAQTRTHTCTDAHPGSYDYIGLQVQKGLSYPHCINQKFKAAPHRNDPFFTYDENQREAAVPSILTGSPQPAQVTPLGSGLRTFSGNIHFLNRTSPPDHKANKNFLARRRAPADRATCHWSCRRGMLVPIRGLRCQVLLIRHLSEKQEPAQSWLQLWK